jgi:hypothetical protein
MCRRDIGNLPSLSTRAFFHYAPSALSSPGLAARSIVAVEASMLDFPVKPGNDTARK